MHLRRNDVLSAECVRTFPTVTVNAQQWFHRLEVELARCESMAVSVLVPPSRKPHARSLNSKAPWVDVYGFRPLQGTPFALLSPFEFLQFWQAEALVPPWDWLEDSRTEWTKEGREAHDAGDFRDGDKKVVPGLHDTVREPSVDGTYYTFQEAPHAIFHKIRHSWVITRRRPLASPLAGMAGSRIRERASRRFPYVLVRLECPAFALDHGVSVFHGPFSGSAGWTFPFNRFHIWIPTSVISLL